MSATELLVKFCMDRRARGFEGTYTDFVNKTEELFPMEFHAVVERRKDKKKPRDIFFQARFYELTVSVMNKDGEVERPVLLEARQKWEGNRTVTVWKVVGAAS